jgi:hypothetical protein
MKKLFLILFLFPVFVFGQINVANNAVTLGGTVGFQLNGAASQWNDVVVPATVTRINPTVSRPVYNYDSLALAVIRDSDSSDIMYYQIQMLHSVVYSTTTRCYPHFHYMQQAAADTTFEVVLMYRIRELGDKAGSWVRLTPSDRAEFTFTSAPFHNICEFPAILLNNINESTYIDFKLFRKDAAGNPATVWMLGFDVHFELNKLGTFDEFPSH